jgi:diaminopimelate decarboxylase
MPARQPLPPPYRWESDGLRLGRVSLPELAEKFGTPLYVSSGDRIRARARAVLQAFQARWPEYRLLYAVKANNNPAIVQLLRSEGCGADCSSPAEIRIAREAGVAPAQILYTAAYPSDPELRAAVEAGVTINLDDPALLPRLLAIGTPPMLSFRINPGPSEAGREGLRFAGPGAKFGTSLGRALAGYRAARSAGIARFGVHTMPGSNVLRAAHFGGLGRFLGRAVRRVESAVGQALTFADAGGGFGVPYRPGERLLVPTAIAERLTAGLRRGLGDGAEPALWNEPGRYLVCDSTVLLARVTHIKDGPRPLVGLDAGMQTLLRPALYGAYHEIYPVVPRPGARISVDLTGPVCENTDMFARGRRLAPLRVGDLVAIGQAGAYGFSMSSQYNTRPRPAEVLVEQDRARPIRVREQFEDLVRNVPAAARSMVAA